MTPVRTLLGTAIAASLLLLSACGSAPEGETAKAPAAAPAESADAFIARVNRTIEEDTPEVTSAQWLSSTYINADTQRVAAAANERWLTAHNAAAARRDHRHPRRP